MRALAAALLWPDPSQCAWMNAKRGSAGGQGCCVLLCGPCDRRHTTEHRGTLRPRKCKGENALRYSRAEGGGIEELEMLLLCGLVGRSAMGSRARVAGWE
jgi:hypothetical protein